MQINSLSSAIPVQTSAVKSGDAEVKPTAAVAYSNRVGDKTYSAEVHPIADEYAGRVPSLFGAQTVAATVDKVEENLSSLINFFA